MSPISPALLQEMADHAKWPFPRDEMIEPGVIVLRMTDDLEALAMRDAPMTLGALIELGWPEDVARHFFPRALQSAAVSRSIAELLRAEFPAPPPTPPPAANDDFAGPPEGAAMRELRAFLFGGAGGLAAAFLLHGAYDLIWRMAR
jgi:hypothetical protein